MLLLYVPLIHAHEYGQYKLFHSDSLFTAWLLHRLQKKHPILFLVDVPLKTHTIIISSSVDTVVYVQSIDILAMFLLYILTYLALMLCSA